MSEIEKYYNSLVQEVVSRQLSNEDGDNQEQTFTRLCLDLLSDVGETENVSVAFDERDLGTKKQHKINGFAIADNYETVDLFISIYEGAPEIMTVSKSDIERAATRVSNFFRKCLYSNYANSIEESSEIFVFANTLATYEELREQLVRVNVFILTNCSYKGEIPSEKVISGYKIFFRVVDINYLYQISRDAHSPIDVYFERDGFKVPCICASSNNPDYEAYIAILPGACLFDMYEQYGGRLLEQNVRSFLQFTGKINKGIRETIKNCPHMFLAYNNGIAATADDIELDESKRFIRKVSNIQIVNGGQTTASIYHTRKKDKADISNVYVQVKFSVIKRKEDFSTIVSDISKYSNTQNKVNNADFSANNPILVELEKVSRYVMTPITAKSSMQTYWFFERARSQYKNIRIKEGFTKSRQKAFDLKYPKNQVFTKVELAKFVNCYEEVYEGSKLVIAPFYVVRGNEKNYAQFIAKNLPTSAKKINNVYYEDVVAKAILFKNADARYGTKLKKNNIGELKSVVVPYTIGLLNHLVNGKLDLYKIWKYQMVSLSLSDFIYNLMVQVNQFIVSNSPSNNYLEWGKKEDCWIAVRDNKNWHYNIEDIESDLIDEKNPVVRKITINASDDDNQTEHDTDLVKSIPYQLWNKIADWGTETGMLTLNQQTKARDIAHNIRFNHRLTSGDISRGMEIFEIVYTNNYEMLQEADSLVDVSSNEASSRGKSCDDVEITIELLKKMVQWDKEHRVLQDWKFRVMYDVVTGNRELNEKLKIGFRVNLKYLLSRGFKI